MIPNNNNPVIPKAVSMLDDDYIIPKARCRVDRNAREPIAPYEHALSTPKFEQHTRLIQRRVDCIETYRKIIRAKVFCSVDDDKY